MDIVVSHAGLPALLLALALAGSSTALPNADAEPGDIAAQTPYVLTPKPNAEYAPERTGRELTDGHRAAVRFWSMGETIGWEEKSPIIYTQVFAAPTAVSAVQIGAGRSAKARIDLPAQALVYALDARGRLEFIGDAMQATGEASGGPGDGIGTVRLSFGPMRIHGMRIVFYRDNRFLFLDNIRIVGAEEGREPAATVAADALVEDAASRRREAARARAGQGPLGADPANTVAWPLDPAAAAGAPGCLVNRVSPWIESTPDAILRAPLSKGVEGINVRGGWLVAAFRVENRTGNEQMATLRPEPADGFDPPGVSAAAYTLSLDYRWRADVLRPGARVVLPSHSAALLVVEARLRRAGDLELPVTVACGSEQRRFALRTRAIPIDPSARPHGNTWSYLVPPTARGLTCRPALHDDFWIDTAVVPAAASRDDRQLRTYFRTFASARRILLFMDLTDPAWPAASGPDLDAALSAFWTGVEKAIREEAVSARIMLYPMDEPGPARLTRLNAAIRTLHEIAPGIPVYGTIDDPRMLGRAAFDVVQALERVVPVLAPRDIGAEEVQVYGTRFNSKTRSLSNYFRRISWTAFGRALSGSGLWSMWDSSGATRPELGWSDFGGRERDFALVYASEDGCLFPSRRLLAWRRGLEDFAILETCRRRRPEQGLSDAAGHFAAREDRNPEEYDQELADLVGDCGATARFGDAR